MKTSKRTTDLFDLLMTGTLRPGSVAKACAINRSRLSQLVHGHVVARADEVAALAKWSGRPRGEIANALATAVFDRVEAVIEKTQ